MFGSAKSERRGRKYLQSYLQYLVGYAVGERRINRPGRTEASSGGEQPGLRGGYGPVRAGVGWGLQERGAEQ